MKGESSLDGHQLRTLREERSVEHERLNFWFDLFKRWVEHGWRISNAAVAEGREKNQVEEKTVGESKGHQSRERPDHTGCFCP
jgi:hypothetical protein